MEVEPAPGLIGAARHALAMMEAAFADPDKLKTSEVMINGFGRAIERLRVSIDKAIQDADY